ncbi:uncharacterized protein TM35_000034060 [Trypanosoma theileri]|uniref:Uncharacterized protein n=1 Tax=Trypanosoma theileri TaxID=67003 RepID=A0A1X0P7P6_9TRYP|nr:uncharacterized protein TM35_000034060 [Trypanosoma theileri]ORC92653.1 hypothetical protein TM35_000034060 [Trypanosoma theileri]
MVRTPSREAVQRQLGRYVRDIHRRQPPLAPHGERNFTGNKRRSTGNSNTVLSSSLSSSYTRVNKGHISTMGQQGVRRNMREEYVTDSFPTAAFTKETPKHGDTTQVQGDDADEERVSNPYIQSVLRGTEQRWVPPSLSESPFDYKSRSQSLQEYAGKHASYLTRQDLLREWKKKMMRSPDSDEKRMLWYLGAADDDKEKDQESYTEKKSSLPLGDINKKDQANTLSGQTGLGSTFVDPIISPMKSDGNVETLHNERSSLKPKEFKHRFHDSKKLNVEKKDFISRDDDHFEDARAYLYASSTVSKSLLNNAESKRLFKGDTSVSSYNRPTSSFYVSHPSGVQYSEVKVEYCGGTVATAPDNRELHSQCKETPRSSTVFTSFINNNIDNNVANYLISKEAELEDAFGTVWLVEAHQAKRMIDTNANNATSITTATMDSPQGKVFSQLIKNFQNRI